jgi:uncharacterized NAD(P)/FAD-binding protein YdhS
MIAETDIVDVAIIGGGFSGLMALHHLTRGEGSFVIIESGEHPGHGLAYSTTNKQHLLNVPAGKMSAFPDQSDHFINWLHAHNHAFQTGDYVPRCMYAQYIDGIARETSMRHIRQRAVDIERDGVYKIKLDNGRVLQSRAVLLATGNLLVNEAGHIPGAVSGWTHDYSALRDETAAVGIIGTGLTMVDTVLSLREAGFKGKIIAASRNGLLPEAHNDAPAVYETPLSLPTQAPETLLSLFHAIRGEAKTCLSNQITWQRVFDRWRPHFSAIWGKLDIPARRHFFKKFFTLWNVHRHRMAPEIRRFLDNEFSRSGLEVLKGSVRITPQQNGFSFTAGKEKRDVIAVYDCRGGCHDITQTGNELIINLHAKGIIQCHDTGWGIKTASDFRVPPLGLDGSFLAIGPILIGEYFETTAVPELRQQAQKAAASLHDFLQLARAA